MRVWFQDWRFSAEMRHCSLPCRADPGKDPGAIQASPTKVHRVMVAAEPVTGVDVAAADALAELDKLEAAGIELVFAELKDSSRTAQERFGLYEQFGDDGFFPTVGAAVDAYCAGHGLEVLP